MSKLEITLRIASRSDLEELIELFDLYRKHYGLKSDYAATKRFLEDRLLHKDSILIVAEDADTILGFAQLYPTYSSLFLKKDYILNDLYVREGARKKGVGKKLLDEAGAVVRKFGGKGMSLETLPDNRAARKLFESFGFRIHEEFLHYYWSVPSEK
ncbi:GNAT family N-acetyltransferase [Leptospira fluminis]|uniref:GNAT family N-acetyltransferase n=1 Tax=Leptospira fluminis TaxID=2484979 RepID=A0A4R9GT13_9LEPT|nr:GNAT family N-acetyltransferase [Leptospira fluminis]TGK20955.1 GNAT family N-acetyltransferase [Leptospira fluminis]